MPRSYKSKWCWIATEVKHGWRLKLCIGPEDYNLRGLVLKSPDEVKKITDGKNGSVVFVHLKNTKYPNLNMK